MERIKIEINEKEKDKLLDCVLMYSKQLIEELKKSDWSNKQDLLDECKNILNIQYKLQSSRPINRLDIESQEDYYKTL